MNAFSKRRAPSLERRERAKAAQSIRGRPARLRPADREPGHRRAIAGPNHDHHALDEVPELAHIGRSGIADEEIEAAASMAFGFCRTPWRTPAGSADQDRDSSFRSGAAAPQRNDIQPVERVLAATIPSVSPQQVLVRSGDEPRTSS